MVSVTAPSSAAPAKRWSRMSWVFPSTVLWDPLSATIFIYPQSSLIVGDHQTGPVKQCSTFICTVNLIRQQSQAVFNNESSD